MLISSHTFAPVEKLYDQSLYVQAYTAAQQIAPLEAWEGTAARILAGRLAATVGAPKLGRQHQLLAYRHDPKDWEARYYYARIMLRSRGALAAWQFLRQHDSDPTLAAADPKVHSDWLALHAFVLARLRDFEGADSWLMRAEQIAPHNVWVWVERAKVFELQDRHEDVLAVLRYALILQPWFRPTIQTSARALVLQGREEEALRLLAQASQHIECAWLVEQLAHLQVELGQYQEASQSLERFVALSPCLEPELWEQLNAERADIAYLSGDYAAALAFAQRCASPALQKFAAQLQQLQNGSPGQRVVLPVGFVRQHHKTCAPATLAAISQYYQMPAEHLRVAEEICHDGTSAHHARKWAHQNGYATREFRVTWENAVELLNHNIVFTLGTVDPGEAHLQAVIGYDSLRGSLIIRDASHRHYSEWDAKPTLARYRACGPRGMALVPTQYEQRLQSLPLTEAELYDHLFAVQEALEKHERAQAQSGYQAMLQRFGEHRLTLQARLALAIYDDDHALMLACYEKLTELFPADATFQLHQALCRRVLAPRQQRLDYLQEICTKKNANPLLWQEYAQELSEDARQWPEALRWLSKALRRDTPEAQSVHLLATIRWQQQRRAEALELYRFAACLDDNDEQFAQAFFLAAHQLEQTEAALEFLNSRLQDKKSGQSVQTLFQALTQIGKTKHALAVLEAGLAKFRADGRLKLFAAEVYARYGLFDQATSLLQQAQAPNNEWLRTAAAIAMLRGQGSEALRHWLQVAEAEPFSLNANQQVAQLLAQTESARAAIEFLRDRTPRYPHSTRLRALLIEWLGNDPALAEPELRCLLKHDATNDWAQRTLAGVLLELCRYEEALVASETACRSNPSRAENHFTRGQMLAQLERYADAREAFHTALTLSADYTPALAQFVATATTPQEQRESLRFVREEITRQVSSGEGLLVFQALAKDVLPADELLQQLQETLQQRPDMPLAWSVVMAQLIGMHQLDEAYSVARQAVERFPLSARLWFDLALMHELRGEDEQQINALQHALTIDPSFARATQKLAEAHERLGQLTEARSVMEQAIAHSPFNHYHHGQLADLCWKLGEKEKALTSIQHVLSLAPDYDWAWRALKTWAEQMQQPTLPLQCAHALTRQRPGDARAWLVLARTLKGEEVLSEQLAALDRAVQLNPRLLEAHTLRVFLLADAGRYDEALRACRPTTLAPMFPPELLSAEAYVIAQCGDLQSALEKMRSVLQAEPNFAPGWERIARWYRTLQMEKEYLEAAHNLARLMPQYSVAHGYLGEAKLWNGDREGAKESLQRAVTLAPDYDFAGLTLFDLHLEDNDLRAAEKTLAKLKQFVGGNATSLRALKLAVCTDDPGQAQRHLFALCQSPVHLPTYLDQAIEALAPTKLSKIIDVVFEDVLARPDINPHIGTLWARRCATQNKPEHCLKRLNKMAAQATGKLWHNAAAAFLDVCANNGDAEHVHSFIRQYDHLLRAETESWGAVGAALYNLGEAQAAADWLHDWRERDGSTPQTLWHLALALRDLNREDEAKKVGLHAINLPEDQRTSSHLALLSLEEALAGQLETATQHAARIAPQALNEWDQVMIELATSLREFHAAHTEGRSSGQAVIDKLLQLAEHSLGLKKSNTLVHLFKRAIENVLTTENDSMLKIKTKLKMKWFEYRAH